MACEEQWGVTLIYPKPATSMTLHISDVLNNDAKHCFISEWSIRLNQTYVSIDIPALQGALEDVYVDQKLGNLFSNILEP